MEESVYKKTVKVLLLVGAVLVPVFFLPWTSSVLELNKQLLVVAIAGVGLVLWLLDIIMSGKLTWRFNSLDKGVLAVAGAVTLSSIFSVDKFKSVFGVAGSLSESLVTILALTIIYLLVVNSFEDNGRKIRRFFSISLSISLIYGLLQILGVNALSLFKYAGISVFDFTSSRAFNTLGTVNVLGMVSAVALPILYKQKIKALKYIDIPKLGALSALAVLMILNSWVLWTVAIAGMIAVVTIDSLNRGLKEEQISTPKFRMSGFIFPMTVTVLGIFFILVNVNINSIKQNLPAETLPTNELSGKVAIKTLKENFALGYGPENFSLAFDRHGVSELRNSVFSSTKIGDSGSHVLNVTVQNGLIGLVALGFVFWLIAYSLIKAIKSKPHGLSPEDVGVISSILAVVVAMFFFPFNLFLIFAFYLILALFVLAIWGDKKVSYNIEEKVSLSLVSSLGFIGGLILALVGLYFSSLNYIADIKYAKAIGQNETEVALEYAVEAINLKSNDDRFYRLGSQLALNLLSRELNTPVAEGDNEKNNRIQNYLSSAVTLAQRATQTAERESTNWVNLGNVYQSIMRLVDGVDALAEEAYLKASELRPGDPLFHNLVGVMYFQKADLLRQIAVQNTAQSQQATQQANVALIKSEDALKKSIEISNNYGLAIYNLGLVYERQGKLDNAIKQLETVAPFNSSQPGLAFELGLLYYRNNQKDKALGELQRAIILSPDYSNARWYLALIYEERNEIELAIEQLERILSLETNKGNQIVIDKIEQLKSGEANEPPEGVIEQQPLQ